MELMTKMTENSSMGPKLADQLNDPKSNETTQSKLARLDRIRKKLITEDPPQGQYAPPMYGNVPPQVNTSFKAYNYLFLDAIHAQRSTNDGSERSLQHAPKRTTSNVLQRAERNATKRPNANVRKWSNAYNVVNGYVKSNAT